MPGALLPQMADSTAPVGPTCEVSTDATGTTEEPELPAENTEEQALLEEFLHSPLKLRAVENSVPAPPDNAMLCSCVANAKRGRYS